MDSTKAVEAIATHATKTVKTLGEFIREPDLKHWARAFDERSTGNADEADLYALPLDSRVGEKCRCLIAFVEGIRSLGLEPDDEKKIVGACVNTMLVWYFG